MTGNRRRMCGNKGVNEIFGSFSQQANEAISQGESKDRTSRKRIKIVPILIWKVLESIIQDTLDELSTEEDVAALRRLRYSRNMRPFHMVIQEGCSSLDGDQCV